MATTFANQKMDGQVVDLNGNVWFTQKNTIVELAKNVSEELKWKWNSLEISSR